MGPRSNERGNSVFDHHREAAARASMGPRSNERGNAGETGSGTRFAAASMGPRSNERGNASKRLLLLLSCFGASMGPRSNERGNTGAPPHVGLYSWSLQWGRAQMSAEIWNDKPERTQEEGFNGAALKWARKWMPAELGNRRRSASMGPRSNERGNMSGEVGHRMPLLASMGPRSNERGNANTRALGLTGTLALQWGRAQMSAEMCDARG